MAETTPDRWTIDADGCHWIRGKNYAIWMNARPTYCDRGNWLAHIEPLPDADWRRLDLDAADGWPRYYFDLDRAKAEVESWLTKRGEI